MYYDYEQLNIMHVSHKRQFLRMNILTLDALSTLAGDT